MSTIIACFKWVVDEAYIRRNSSGSLDFSSVDFKISEYDRNAIEEAVRLRDDHGGTVIAMTVGTPEAAKGVKDALSRGADQACFIADEAFSDLEPSLTAAFMAEVIRGRFADYSLILCGEGSGDLYAQQVGPALAEYLEIPCVSYVQKVSLRGEVLVAERRVEEGIEVVEARLPALVTVCPDVNVPRIPGVRDTLGASKKPVMTLGRADLVFSGGPFLRTVSLTAAPMDRSCERFPADSTGIRSFVDALQKKGVIP
ncbi:MAG: electron transfer flavoprotein subunit beta/FixA family protein [Syntrophales bacterium]|jgi:electron transfer flavoprotein beta subunit|nr:electron transfer flavoprotein subunit beta/FixA family protein [Syntrophales bacterium]MCK9528386.1 electron transfer flavoprotein subunit beta/FixA family protein [Syntrophales bacterium]MDX9922689.1 electron transfer flavoprotein subunit beta/FixA family protein [Syntrophales bacterium]